MRKRIISLLLSLTMIISMMPMFTTTASAAKQTHYCDEIGSICGEIPYAYRAMQVSHSEDFFITWINMYELFDNASGSYPYDAEKFNSKIEESLARELAKGFDPTLVNISTFADCCFSGSFTDRLLTEYDLYDALFMCMLLGTVENEEKGKEISDFSDELLNLLTTTQSFTVDGNKVLGSIVDMVKNGVINPKNVDAKLLSQCKTFSTITNKMDKMFGIELNNQSVSGITVLLTFLQGILEVTTEVVEIKDAIYNCFLIYNNCGPVYADVLDMICQNTSDTVIIEVAGKYRDLINSTNWIDIIVAVAKEIVLGTAEMAGGVAEILLKTAASILTPYGIVAGTVATLDLLFGTSAEVEAAYALICMHKIDDAMGKTLTELDTSFKREFDSANDEKASEYAHKYVTASIMCLRMLQKEYDYCQDYFDAIYKAGLINTLKNCFPNADKEKLEGWTNHVAFMKSSLNNISKSIFEEDSDIRGRYHNHVSIIEKGMKVTYDLNGGSDIEDFAPQTKAYNLHMITRSGTPMKEGYVFTGWRPTINGNYINPVDFWYYKDENAISPGINPCYFADEIVLTAQWTETQDTISYNANGGTGAPAAHENTDGPTELSTTVPTRTGFTFLGWDENPNVKEPTYRKTSDGSPIIIDKEGSVTLYAIWEAGVFDIVFHANGGVYADNSDSKTMQKTYLQNFTVNPEIPTRDGYVFSGYWTLNADGSGTQYTQGKTYSDIGGAGLSAKHLYAHWTKVKTEVTFRYDYTNCTYTDITIPLTNGSASITLIDPPAEKIAEIGKEFVQWKYYYPDGSGYKYYQTGDTIILTDDMTLYAEWADPAGDTLLSVFTDKTSYMPGDTVKINITADNSGYFTVDASDNTGFTIQNAEGGKTATGVFVENSSESTSTNLKCYDNGSVYTVMLYIPNNCSDGAYTVDIVASNGTYGVSDTETSTASETITITVDTSEEEVASYVLSYNLNGGYGTIPDSEYFEEDDHVELADDSGFQRDGYEFGGWSKNSDGSGKTYKAGRDYQFTESTQLYAIWEPVAADADELSLALGVERYSKVYKPGETAHIIVSPDNSDHFFIDVSDCAGFTVLSAMGTKLTEATYIEYSSPAFISGRDGYTDGSNKYIPVYIPSNCKDGQYTFFVTATDGILDQTSGETIKCSVTIYVRESDIPDSIQLSKSEITLHVGDEKRLKATVEPQYIFNEYNEKEVTWSTSNKNVASIDDKGNSVDISGVKSGTSTITATVDGISASCTVTVVRCDHSLKIVEPEYLASAATCEKQAEYYYVCSCGDVGSATYKVGELADHNYSGWTVIQEATETTAGVEQRVCSACGATEERSIPATGAHTTHTPGTAWYSDSEKHWHVCSVDGCTVKLNEDTHDFGELSVETPATETNTGIGYRTCELCGYTKSEVIPVLEPTLYTVTVTNGSGDGEYAAGATVLITADAPESGKQFKEWVGLDGVNIISGSINTATVVFTMPENAVNASATYEDIPVDATYSVTVQTDGNGTASATPASATVGTKITLNATANNGYHFKEWQVVSGDVTITNNQFTMPDSNVIIKAIFEEDVPVLPTTYSITVQTDGNGTASATPASATAGAEITLSATANSGYHFKEWQVISGDVTITNNKFVMPDGDVTVKAIFEEDAPVVPTTYTITIINGAANKATAVEGETVTITADAPEAGKRFKEWTGADGLTFTSGSKTSATATFTMPAGDVNVTATYEDVPVVKYDVTVNGSCASTTGAGEYEVGETVTISAGTRSGYTFAGWTSSDVTINNKYSNTATFTMPAKHVTVTANWTKDSGGIVIPTVFPVTVKDSDNGEVTASSKYAAPGTTVMLTVTPDEGYELDVLTVKYGSKEIQTTLKNGKYQFTMPYAGVTVTATFKKIETPVVPVVPSFDDVAEDTYYFDAVEWAVENGITTGTSDTTFSPNVTCTRAQAVTFLWRAAGSPEPKSNVMPFEDVAAEAYYYKAVLWAVENGITNGTSATTFGPNADCTRAQIVTFLWRSQKSPAITAVNPFADVAAEAYYYDAVLWAVDEKITNGTSETTFSPDADCTRAQIVTFLYRCLGDK